MDLSLILEYSWVLLVLIGLEGLLAADNALVLAVLVKHLPEEQRKKALMYGLAGAFIFRFGSLFFISFLVDVWQVQAIGALYLLFICFNFMWKRHVKKQVEETHGAEAKKGSGFWMTILKVELADIAFAVDSILAAVALAVTLTPTGIGTVGSLDTGQFAVIFIGGVIGIVIMRFAANKFVYLLEKFPGLETAAFAIVGWVGVKLVVLTLAHPDIHLISHEFAHSGTWKAIFWAVLLSIVAAGVLFGRKKTDDAVEQKIEA
ncbi:MAG: TerC family protein [Bacilli bacterium]